MRHEFIGIINHESRVMLVLESTAFEARNYCKVTFLNVLSETYIVELRSLTHLEHAFYFSISMLDDKVEHVIYE